jgi:hypothetical protein
MNGGILLKNLKMKVFPFILSMTKLTSETVGAPETLWSRQHPENWSTSAVQEWMAFTCNKYNFPEHLRARITGSLHGYTGKRLLAMLLPDFRIQFGDIGEIIFTALQQILDVAPHYKGNFT